MTLHQATKSKEIRELLKEVLSDNKSLGLYLDMGGKHAKLTNGAHSLTIPSSPSDRKSVKNFQKELVKFLETKIKHA
ncbi:hypothetical protein [Helicobacter cetorum]|uniref:hypothetical protein n=1 Tax=Helicobacter cetorum TaxID=138563 RepID=UPI000CF16707|nr:hypothetical protein [Helicobacter cetorum]